METGNVHSSIYYYAFWNSRLLGLFGREPLGFLKNKEYTKS